jgi:hypothetical protein
MNRPTLIISDFGVSAEMINLSGRWMIFGPADSVMRIRGGSRPTSCVGGEQLAGTARAAARCRAHSAAVGIEARCGGVRRRLRLMIPARLWPNLRRCTEAADTGLLFLTRLLLVEGVVTVEHHSEREASGQAKTMVADRATTADCGLITTSSLDPAF